MRDTTNPTYSGPDGTYLDVRPAPARAPEGAVLLNVSGHAFGLKHIVIVKLVDLLAGRSRGRELHVAISEDAVLILRVVVSMEGADFAVFNDGTPTHQVFVPAEHGLGVASQIAVAGMVS
ncbi:hypothetical protein [Nonomuraea sp. NPDC050786]|uniref:hypothetical protein n=1 Tax=Nonomuraea sp. NPDC050786 TaxID=3154840 RepID=UPI0033EC0A15